MSHPKGTVEWRVPSELIQACEGAGRALSKVNVSLDHLAKLTQREWQSAGPPMVDGRLVYFVPEQIITALEASADALEEATKALNSLDALRDRFREVVEGSIDLLGDFVGADELDDSAPAASSLSLRELGGDGPAALGTGEIQFHGGSPSRGVSGSPPRGTEEEDRLQPNTTPDQSETQGEK